MADLRIASGRPHAKLALYSSRTRPMLPRPARIAALAAIMAACLAHDGAAQGARGTRKDASAIRACADKYAQNINEAERRCIFAIVVEPCTKTRIGQSSQGASACYHVE